jgi:hypothetical protein
MSNRIFVFNRSTVLKNTDMFLMINAMNVMLPAFCKAWSLKQCTCIAAPPTTKPGTNGMYCVFLDNSTSPGALAFHTEYDNVPYGEIFVKTIITIWRFGIDGERTIQFPLSLRHLRTKSLRCW